MVMLNVCVAEDPSLTVQHRYPSDAPTVSRSIAAAVVIAPVLASIWKRPSGLLDSE